MIQAVQANGLIFHVSQSGNPQGQPVMFANSLGTDLRLWDRLLPLLPQDCNYVRFDLRGHGLSQCPPGPYTMPELARDAAGIVDALELGPVIFVGLSIGGMIGQQLAADRPDLLKALVLSNTAARMGTSRMWRERINAISKDGLQSMEPAILDRWFGPAFRTGNEVALWGAMLTRTPLEGYLGCCEAIAATDLTEATRKLELPTLAIAGECDGASPPELVAETATMIDGAHYHMIEGAGHLPCVETPAVYGELLSSFFREHTND